MNYKEEYYKLIENQTFYHLPEQQIINYDERVALAIMKNYRNRVLYNEYEYDSYDRFQEIKFNEILFMYKTNKSFWDKTNIEHLILQEGFRQQFPEISFQFLSDKEFLLKLLNKNEKIVLESLNRIVSEEEFEKLEKSFLLSNASYASIEDINKYQNDKAFIMDFIKKRPYIYPELSEIIKNDEQIIKVYLGYDKSILNFPREKQNKLFVSWAKLHRDWDMKIIDQLDYEYLKPIMKKINKTNNEYLMQKLLSRNINKYKEVIIDFFEQNKNINYFFKMLREKPLENLWPVIKGLDCTQYLQQWINSFSYKKEDNFDKKILEIMKYYPEIENQWKNSFDGKLFQQINNNEALIFEQFREALEIQFKKLHEEKIDYEKLQTNMTQLKKYLPVSILKEMRIPNKNIVEYLQHMKFNEKFIEKGLSVKKTKI